MSFIVSMGWYILPFLGVLSILVFVHELGHYLVARYNGVGVDVFSIGFGPELFGWHDKAGTRWKISLLPLGGYVKMVGDADAASTPDHKALKKMKEDQRSKSLFYKSVWQRIAVSAAGPIANYLFAILVFTALFATMGKRYTLPVIDQVVESGPAAKAGLQKGDRIVTIEGTPIKAFEEAQAIIVKNPGKPLRFGIQKAESTSPTDLTIAPEPSEITDYFGRSHRSGVLGVKAGQTAFDHLAGGQAFVAAVSEVFTMSWETLKSLGNIIIGARSAEDLGGPLRIAKMSGEIAQTGFVALIWFMGVLSVNLGLINFFPVPMLDGGHLLFYFIEVILGRPLSEKAQEWGFKLGFALVIVLMLLATWNDLVHIFFK